MQLIAGYQATRFAAERGPAGSTPAVAGMCAGLLAVTGNALTYWLLQAHVLACWRLQACALACWLFQACALVVAGNELACRQRVGIQLYAASPRVLSMTLNEKGRAGCGAEQRECSCKGVSTVLLGGWRGIVMLSGRHLKPGMLSLAC